MNNIQVLELIRDIIDNEHGGKVYDTGTGKYIPINWDEFAAIVTYGDDMFRSIAVK